jgi:hypothetical protein
MRAQFWQDSQGRTGHATAHRKIGFGEVAEYAAIG